ncbi:Fic/DOC family protein [Subtercola lobariae]|uniref:protein adenylyltransferase n=1 Tax=Subtercola lobariae TaxID=1588641 RepID=A0A917BFV3_9MICO|nr:Fic family protein [Subtercola lobariae]GGF37931.1 hypothetical protein GCM10011399_33650 [Subtercola lobariae]
MQWAQAVISMVDGPEAAGQHRARVTAVAAERMSADDAVLETIHAAGLRRSERRTFRARSFEDYLIPGTIGLRNRLVDDEHPDGIDDTRLFRELEIQITHLRLVELTFNPAEGYFDYDHLKLTHRRIFSDIFDWAGTERVGPDTPLVRYARDSTQYAPGDPEAILVREQYYPGPEISEAATAIFTHLQLVLANTSLSRPEKLERLAECGELNAVHPFRDGNGRTMFVFTLWMSAHLGIPIDPASCLPSGSRSDMIIANRAYQQTGDFTQLKGTFDHIYGGDQTQTQAML